MYTMDQVQAFYKKTEPKLCNQVVKMYKKYEYVPQENPFTTYGLSYNGIEKNTERVIEAMKELIKKGIPLEEEIKYILTKKGIDLNACDLAEITEICDKLILVKYIEEFELLYHYGNLDMQK